VAADVSAALGAPVLLGMADVDVSAAPVVVLGDGLVTAPLGEAAGGELSVVLGAVPLGAMPTPLLSSGEGGVDASRVPKAGLCDCIVSPAVLSVVAWAYTQPATTANAAAKPTTVVLNRFMS